MYVFAIDYYRNSDITDEVKSIEKMLLNFNYFLIVFYSRLKILVNGAL